MTNPLAPAANGYTRFLYILAPVRNFFCGWYYFIMAGVIYFVYTVGLCRYLLKTASGRRILENSFFRNIIDRRLVYI